MDKELPEEGIKIANDIFKKYDNFILTLEGNGRPKFTLGIVLLCTVQTMIKCAQSKEIARNFVDEIVKEAFENAE